MVRERMAQTLLFESGQDEETMRIECHIGEDGCLHVVQLSAGPWSSWCFGDDPHRVEIMAPRKTVDALCAHFNLAEACGLPVALQLVYAGLDAMRRIYGLMESLRLDCEVR